MPSLFQTTEGHLRDNSLVIQVSKVSQESQEREQYVGLIVIFLSCSIVLYIFRFLTCINKLLWTRRICC